MSVLASTSAGLRAIRPTPPIGVASRLLHHTSTSEPHATLSRVTPDHLPSGAPSLPDQRDTGIRLLTLNRPRAKNAISRQMLDELTAGVTSIQKDEQARVLVVRGKGGAFCAGADLKERATMTPEQTEGFLRDLRAVITRIAQLEVPVIAALDGAALGGGLELALAADFRVGSTLASPLGLPETARGIIPGAGGTARLPRTTTVGTALLLILTARTFTAEQAYARGIIDVLTPAPSQADDAADGAAYHVAMQLASEIAANAPIAVRAAKKSVLLGLERDLDQALDWEAECYQPLLSTEDRLEGLLAFREKRLPRYKGK